MTKIISIVVLSLGLLIPYTGDSNIEPENPKLLHHVLLFKWNEVNDLKKQQELIEIFSGLPNKIEGFEEFKIYKIQNSSDGFNVVLTLGFISEEAKDSYIRHPDHKRIENLASNLLSGFAEYDYWK